MDMMEKVEKLRAKANVSYEEAKSALDEANGDLLDAMILLEKQGKVEAPKSESYSTKYEDNVQYPVVVEQPNREKRAERETNRNCQDSGDKFKNWVKNVWKKGNENYLVVTRHDDVIVDIPVWVFVLILLLAWQVTLVVMLISLFLGCRYQFVGPDDLGKVNEASSKVSEAAEKIKDEFTKK